jgi:hypothetical protein
MLPVEYTSKIIIWKKCKREDHGIITKKDYLSQMPIFPALGGIVNAP